MRFLHTSDWHLGRPLATLTAVYSRQEEQRAFIDELERICDEKAIDFIIVAGDVYDSFNPPAAAEKLFYDALMRLGKNGRRPIIVISGNHDSPDKLTVARPLAGELGIALFGNPKSAPALPAGGRVIGTGELCVELDIRGERAVVAALPYVNETRLDEILFDLASSSEADMRRGYSEKIRRLFEAASARFRGDAVNLAAAHFYITGGTVSGSEENMKIGGVYAVDADSLPARAQYIAMGHLHRAQKCAGTDRAHYCGSPFCFDRDEAGAAKYVYVVDVEAGGQAAVERVPLTDYKPIYRFSARSPEEAEEYCGPHRDENCWIFITLCTSDALAASGADELRRKYKNIAEIEIALPGEYADQAGGLENAADVRSMYDAFAIGQAFKDFYAQTKHAEPDPELLELFLDLCEVADEADNA